MAKVIKTISGIPITITPKYVEFGKNPHNWESKMFLMKHIERVDIGYDGELKIVTASGSEKIFGRDISMEQSKEACALIKKHISGEHTENQIDLLYDRMDGLVDENDDLKKKISRLESLVGDLLEKMSVSSVPEGDLLG